MSEAPSVVLVAAPLMARSGVYRTAHDLVRAARAQGKDWTAVLGMRGSASGEPVLTDGVRELEVGSHGLSVISEIRDLIDGSPEVASADVVITLISQTDMAMRSARARRRVAWVCWVRGKPWPAAGEQGFARRTILKVLETRALRAADAVWATTTVLADEFVSARAAEIVPAGIAAVPRSSWGDEPSAPLVWAGRVDVDKRPELFARAVELLGHPARVHGDGPLLERLSSRPVDGLEWCGWSDAASLWDDASIFVGTSSREAFGRSAVEAAAAGLPVVIGADYGAAPLLVTAPELAGVCIIDSDAPEVWAAALRRILDDDDLRARISDHVHANAQTLTIDGSVAAVETRLAQLGSVRAAR